ncbi:hypothetical protein J3F83DRAFT_204918 [Trichoderma novae-zelandiae]
MQVFFFLFLLFPVDNGYRITPAYDSCMRQESWKKSPVPEVENQSTRCVASHGRETPVGSLCHAVRSCIQTRSRLILTTMSTEGDQMLVVAILDTPYSGSSSLVDTSDGVVAPILKATAPFPVCSLPPVHHLPSILPAITPVQGSGQMPLWPTRLRHLQRPILHAAFRLLCSASRTDPCLAD